MKKIIGLFVLIAMFTIYAIQFTNTAHATTENVTWGTIKAMYGRSKNEG